MDSPRLAWDADLFRTELTDDYDQILHQSLTKIFGDRRLTRDQIKDLLRGNNSVIKSILVRQEPLLGALFSNEQLEKASLLWIAVLCRYRNSVELLVRSGADVNKTFRLARIGLDEGSTVLHAMVRGYSSLEDERLIRLVTNHGADLETQDNEKHTVLHYAVKLDRVEVAQMFLDNGADVSYATILAETPFFLIVDKNLDNPMVQLIVKALALKKCKTSINLKDESPMKRHSELWEYYRDCINHINMTKFTRFDKSFTFFQLLTQCPCSIAALMRRDRDIWDFERNFRCMHDLNGFSMYAEDLLRAFKRARNLYKTMLEQEDVINEAVSKCYCENLGRRKLALLLSTSIRTDQVELVETLLVKGADVNCFSDMGRTAILEAVDSSKADKLVPLLIKHGADVFAKDRYSANVLHILAGSSVERPDLARVFIEMGVSVRDADSFECQPIHKAVLGGKNELVKLFLDHGADVNALVADGDESPLYLAAECSRPAVLKTLLERGADVDQRTTEGRTALHTACERFNETYIRLLLTAGADVLAEDHEGKTPFALIRRGVKKTPSIWPMIKALALKKIRQPSIKLKDEKIMRKYPKIWKYYRDCLVHSCRMQLTRFFESCTFFDLLTKNRCQIAMLMRNPNFEANLQLYDLSEFSMYTEDILGALERARNHYHARLEQEDVINDAVNYILPDTFVWEVVRKIFPCCENSKCE